MSDESKRNGEIHARETAVVTGPPDPGGDGAASPEDKSLVETPNPLQDTPERLDADAQSEAPKRPVEREERKLFIVGIGASAGGLEALGELVKHVPLDNMAFVVVQHLAPQHESLLPDLLARTSKLEVVAAAEGMVVEPGHVYVIPPNTDLAVMQGVLHLLSPTRGHGPRLPIDFFFRSLAEDKGPCASGIILSGTGTDGTFGLKAIKAAGGVTFVQEPATAKFDSMPRSALQSGSADYCLPVEKIGEELARIARQTHTPVMPRRPAPGPDAPEQLAKLFLLIRSELGNDLSNYKPATVERRIERRMLLHKMNHLHDYLRYVQSSPEELRALYADMLITVTSFFRDPEVFDVLRTEVLSPLLDRRDPDVPIRVWVPACATGEEAYSIAISVLELLDERAHGRRVQIFATDIDDDAIQQARRGVYPQNIAADVSPERLARFFTRKGTDYVITRQVRDMVVFSRQNLLKDAPFSRIDLVTCRNVLIYLRPAAQRKVLRILHYALNPAGFLLLGTSETVSDAPELFSVVDRRNKLYSKKFVALGSGLDVGFSVPGKPDGQLAPGGARPPVSLQALADRKVLELYGPPGVVINDDLEILHFRGRTGPYLDPAPGAASFHLLRLARPELHMELRRAIQHALTKNVRVTVETPLHDEAGLGEVRLDVVPIQEPESRRRCLLVLFHRVSPPLELPGAPEGPGEPGEASVPLTRRIQELEHELALLKEYLQSTIEEKESANEELKSANEELQSSNEEMQSTNEELETSKEEMQSTNEELTTVNEELQNRMDELSLVNDDLHNLLSGTDSPVVIVGMDLRIRRYTAAAERLFNLVPADLGRSIGFLDPFLGDSQLGARISAVIGNLAPLEQEILASNQRHYSLKITPYKTLDHSIRGAVVCLTDIDVAKRASELTRDVGEFAGRLFFAIGHPLVIVDTKLRIVWANEAFHEAFHTSADETIGRLLPSVGARTWAAPDIRSLIEGTATAGKPFRDSRIQHTVPGDVERRFKVGASRLPVVSDAVLVLISIEEEAREPGRVEALS